jgi:hypothetical protein
MKMISKDYPKDSSLADNNILSNSQNITEKALAIQNQDAPETYSIIKISKHAYITSNVPGTRKPIILLCGWLDGQYQYLVKYLELYVSLGFPVVMLESVSADLTFYLTSFVHNDTAKVLKHILPKDATYVPHLMSNGGIRSFFSLKDNFDNFDRTLPISAIVLDSCPSVLPKDITKSKVDPRSIFFRNVKPVWLRETLLYLIISAWEIQKYWYTFFPQTHILNRQYKRLLSQFQGIPKLFLYSDSDNAVASDQINLAIDACKDSSPVEAINFVTSPHVRHFQEHRIRYIQTILWFLNTYLPIKIKPKL